MATSPINGVILHRRAVLLRDGAGLTDGQLLESFINRKDEAAFEALVRRHGPMVMGVCRRLLRNHHDAEDAFQATFLVLVRKAAAIMPREMVGNWLHGVAYHTALKARAASAKRAVRERQVMAMPEVVQQEDLWHELRPLLDQELSRLPEKYRVPIILCDLENKSIKEAARNLAWPQGTLAGRLARKRTMLAKRLARHGLMLSRGALAAALAQSPASACLPTSVVSSTIKAASLFAARKAAAAGVISPKVAALTEGVLKTMLLTKLKTAAGVLLVGAAVGMGGRLLTCWTTAAEQTGEKTLPKAAPAPPPVPPLNRQADPPKTHKEKLHGTWRVVWLAARGKQTFPKDMKWTLENNKIVMSQALIGYGKPGQGRQEATYQLGGDSDSITAVPTDINMTVGATFRGIVAWDKGRLKLCFRTLGSGERPTEIPTAPGEDEDLFVVVLEREEVAGRRPTEKDQTLLSTTQDGFRTDKAKLQGDWKLVGGEVNGEKIDVAGFGKLTIDGDRMILPEGEPCQVSFKLDTTKKPKQISLIIKSFGTGSKDEGIYSLDGDDLKFCFPDKGKDATPPQDFVTKEGSGHRLFIFKRDKLSAAPTE